MNPIILSDNRFWDGTPTATDTASGYDVLHVRDRRSYTAWKAASAGTKYITVDCGTPQWADTIGYAFGNLNSVAALVSVEYSSDGVAWSEAIAPYQFVSDRPRLVVFTAVQARYWRVKIVTGSTAAQIGELCLGSRIEFPQPPVAPYAAIDEGIEAGTTYSKAGALLGSVLRYHPRDMALRFETIPRTWVDTNILPWWEDYAGELKPFFVAWDLYNNPWQVEFAKVKDSARYRPTASVAGYYDDLAIEMESVRSTAQNQTFLEWWYSEGLNFYAPFDDPNDPLKLYLGAGALSFTRATTATYVHPVTGLVTQAAVGQLRIEANGALIEGQRTNLALRSEEFSTYPPWYNNAGGVLVTPNDAIGPDGQSTADKIEDNPGSPNSTWMTQLLGGLTGEKTLTVSCWMKGDGVKTIQLAVWDDVLLWQTSGNFTPPATWTRYSFTATTNLGTTQIRVGFNAVPLGGVYVAGYQCEEGTFASSYIPTTTVAVTRDADLLSAAAGNVPEGPFTLAYEFERVNNTAESNIAKAPVHIGTYATNASIVIGGYAGVGVTALANFGTTWSLDKGFAVLSYGTKYRMAFRLAADGVTVSHARNGAMDPNGDGVASPAKTAVWVGGRLDIGNINGTITSSDTMFHIKTLRIWSGSFSDVEIKAVAT